MSDEKSELRLALEAYQSLKKGRAVNFAKLPRGELYCVGAGTKSVPNTKTDVYVMGMKDPDGGKTNLTKREARWLVVVPKSAGIEIERVHMRRSPCFFAFQDTEGGYPVRVQAVAYAQNRDVSLLVLEHSPKDRVVFLQMV